MTTMEPTRDGLLNGPHGPTWWRVTAPSEADHTGTPLVVLHGGPGFTHDYLLGLAALALGGRKVIHYDQLGSGRSAHLPDAPPSFWTVGLFLDELDALLDHLGVAENYFLLGQSWGGMLAAEHAVRRPAGLRGLVLANTPASMDLWSRGVLELRAALPPSVRAVLTEHELAGTTDSIEYLDACTVFYDRHVCRVLPNPDVLLATFSALEEDPTVYRTMCGPTEFHIIGTLVGWSVIDRLDEINVPTLVISGVHDEATDLSVTPFVDRVRGAAWVKFANSSHMPHLEETDRFLEVVSEFLLAQDQ